MSEDRQDGAERSAERDAVGPTDSRHEVAAFERLVGGVAHDLNNLSTAIRASVDSLRASIGDTELDTANAAPHLDRIERASEQSAALMGALAAFGRTEPAPVSSDVNAILEAGGQFLRRALGSEVDLNLPNPMTASVAIDADLAMLVRAMIHLCGHAAAASGRIRLSSAGREIVIELSPRTGRGDAVAPSEADVAKARALLEATGAHLSLSFADGRGGWDGSITMPRASAPRPATPGARSPRGRVDAPRGCALVAEDHEQVREALRDALARCGFQVESVADGDALVDRGLAAPDAHDVLLIDYDLPGRDGASALETLREAGNLTPALMISGNVDFRPRLDRLENTEFLQKPFGLADIRAWATRQLEVPAGAEGGSTR